jgi:glycosyltransferase involved in cell wall biosynthesis
MTHKPLVSAIVATYNRAHIVGQAIESIIRQTYENIEIVIVDDGSTDDTLQKLAEFGKRITVISQNNAGPAAARNRGIKESTGEIVTFLDSDDIWLPAFIERHVNLLQSAGETVPCSLANSWLDFSDGQRRTSFDVSLLQVPDAESIWLNVADVLASRFLMFTQMVAVRRSALKRSGGFDENLWSLEDYDLALKLSFEGPWGLISEPLVVWHQGSAGSLSKKAYEDQIKLKQNMITVKTRALSRLRDAGQLPSAQKILNRELQYANLDLRAAKMEQRGTSFARGIARLLNLAERVRNFTYRRSPWFPKVACKALQVPSVQLTGSEQNSGNGLAVPDRYVIR